MASPGPDSLRVTAIRKQQSECFAAGGRVGIDPVRQANLEGLARQTCTPRNSPALAGARIRKFAPCPQKPDCQTRIPQKNMYCHVLPSWCWTASRNATCWITETWNFVSGAAKPIFSATKSSHGLPSRILRVRPCLAPANHISLRVGLRATLSRIIFLCRVASACDRKLENYVTVPQRFDQCLLKYHIHLVTHSSLGANIAS
jgi:hypothetical protein